MMMLTQSMSSLSLYSGPAFSLREESKKRNKIGQAASSSSTEPLAITDTTDTPARM